MKITTIGLDLAKSVFHVVCLDDGLFFGIFAVMAVWELLVPVLGTFHNLTGATIGATLVFLSHVTSPWTGLRT